LLKEFNTVKNTTTPWLCFRDPDSKLVYFVHSKCACSFYRKLFTNLGWKVSATTEIDWTNDMVFSYIRDPLEKHRIGIIEWFYYENKIDILKNNADDPDFFTMLSRISFLDCHSMSIYEHLGDNSALVKWIPIDQPGVDHKQRTIELIQQHSKIDNQVLEWFRALKPVHVSSGFKKECYNKLMQLPVHPLIIKSIDYDRCLYDSVTKQQFEPENYAERIMYLKSQGMTQAQAETSADHDISTGAYLNWNQRK
jgi:hypothetical protein